MIYRDLHFQVLQTLTRVAEFALLEELLGPFLARMLALVTIRNVLLMSYFLRISKSTLGVASCPPQGTFLTTRSVPSLSLKTIPYWLAPA